ncbi:hypothetical protein PVAP13_4KG135700 [Panicum virgatum]|uniref:Uncharacterized protein n=1 Tax=Panicum virgatum TaxID=38727 RepID=A0A8T0TH61_PANVG|nr:hypothetical protein PVAP13_4KG135700 [Panicum virgatum]
MKTLMSTLRKRTLSWKKMSRNFQVIIQDQTMMI